MDEHEYMIQRCLVLSTAHQPESWPDYGDEIVYPYEYGTFVYVSGLDPDAPEPEWLRPIFALARELDCNFVRFDRDGDTYNTLPIYDW